MKEETEPPVFFRFLSSINLPDRAIVSIVGTSGLVAGFWIGVVSVPEQALDVPQSATDYGPELAYLPVPTWAIPVTVFALLFGAVLTWLSIRPVVEDALGEPQ